MSKYNFQRGELKASFGIDPIKVANNLEISHHHDLPMGMLCIGATADAVIVPYLMPVAAHPHTGLYVHDESASPSITAYVDRFESRWWLFTWTPCGAVVRLVSSYPDKTAAVQATALLGYKLITKPQPPHPALKVMPR